MKIRGVILATCALMVFWACYACANEPEPQTPSSAAPVMVPYLNKSISEVMQNEYEFVTDANQSATDRDQYISVENLDNSHFRAVLTNTGRMEGREDSESFPELVESEPDESAGRAEDPVLTDWVYYGNCRITHYDAGPCCCGEFATGCTASGVLATINHTVASGEDLPFGTEVLINGQIYVVEDRGVDPYQFDIFVSTHDEALAMGMYYTDVYVR